jgi:PTH1 family peptidyl-tRNA hydrolase
VAFLKHIFGFFLGRREPQAAGAVPFGAEYIIFGIGNEGNEYFNTRHNVGFMVVDRCLRQCDMVRGNATGYGSVATGKVAGKNVAFIKPNTFVNRCGTAFKSSMEEFGVPLGSCLVVVDDYNLPLGTLRFRKEGSDGGHNGLKSIIDAVGTGFSRLRIGVGPLPKGINPVVFVLGAFTGEEEKVLSKVIDKAVEGVAEFLRVGIEKAMLGFNGPVKA